MKTERKKILFYSDRLSLFDYGPGHPFKPSRAKHFYELLNRYSLISEPDQSIETPRKLDEQLAQTFHTARYLDLLKRSNAGEFTMEMLQAGIGNSDNPVRAGMLDYSLEAAGATWQGAQALARGEASLAFNPHGGFHHAGRDYAEGFCYINDIAIAVMGLLGQNKKIAYLDIDAHHGNGVQDAFYADNRVLVISLHESGKTLYPWGGFEHETGAGPGKGANVTIPFLQGTDDEVYLKTFDDIVPPLIRAFKPDVLFIEIGGDSHRSDPLTHLNLTSGSYETVLHALKKLCPAIMATGGGGYDTHKTASLWALAWATLCGIEIVDSFAGLVGGMMYGPESLTGSLRDDPFVLEGIEKEKCRIEADRVASYIKSEVFPIHGIA
jgi:acetoin utilization protein AcuC